MRIAKAEEQGIRLMLRLARRGGQMTLGALARIERLPEPTVAKLLGRLRHAGLVKAIRGRNGGYDLSAAPDAISTSDIIQAMGLPRFKGRFCKSHVQTDEACPNRDDCTIRGVLDYLEGQMFTVLDQTSLATLMTSEPQARRHVNRIWGDGEVLVVDEIDAAAL
jgi:Rrf2 family protein